MIEYGIGTSEARIWLHVCPHDMCIYWYSRARMLEVMTKYQHVKIKSAQGHLVRLSGNRVCDGGFIFDAGIKSEWVAGWRDLDSDSEAGAIAERVFEQCVKSARFAVPARATRYDAKEDQFKGKDYRVTPFIDSFDVEVKADFVGGEWGSGNLFIQTHELRHDWAGRNSHRGLNEMV